MKKFSLIATLALGSGKLLAKTENPNRLAGSMAGVAGTGALST